ncbi:hypothetical protein A2Z33_00240 [Candidatus Gottesmanbacteria bacterium RBG_16_52_11]|uniref:Carboxypeptidase regulatory-like domain-containing protein n=1 Tax=Candidatus Gottesmanbacteria bacterium RBG_16_52_11 TaxID=1798374 RepID=A0A1F5YNM4_9BACT|nr:MAG: hypothetical protein A2Z33_00240 [Candidatus Gottesmanbacteria bacterium RBG_16_52_11]
MSLVTNLHRIKLSFEGLIILTEKKLRRLLFNQKPSTLLIGFVESAAGGMPVHHASAFLVNRSTKAVVSRDITNDLGEFHLKVTPGNDYDLVIRKPGFDNARYMIGADVLFENHPPFVLKPETRLTFPPVLDFSLSIGRGVFRATSDVLLFAVGIFNVLLFIRLGARVLPLWVITALNTFLWLRYHWVQWKSGNK